MNMDMNADLSGNVKMDVKVNQEKVYKKLKYLYRGYKHKNPTFDLTTAMELGLGGLDTEFKTILRRALASRFSRMPKEIKKHLGVKHVKGILLYGPPGTGKTLMAKQMATLVKNSIQTIRSGPQLLSKFVGDSEAAIRELFEEAQYHEKKYGDKSPLHIIIIDEFDALFQTRGTGINVDNSTLVNQLLALMDGPEQLNNILVFGMTNRKEVIDEALLRPGRFEIHIKIGLPNDDGRRQILNVHMKRMMDANLVENEDVAERVDIDELVTLTKDFSGAELEGLVKAAVSHAQERCGFTMEINIKTEVQATFKLTRKDFMDAFDQDTKPAFRSSIDLVQKYCKRGIWDWCDQISRIKFEGEAFTKHISSRSDCIFSILLEGAPQAGTTALGAYIASNTGYPLIQVCTAKDMNDFPPYSKDPAIKKYFFNAYESDKSCILFDDVGPTYSYETLKCYLKNKPEGKKLLVIGTTSTRSDLDRYNITGHFTSCFHVPNITKVEEIIFVLERSKMFRSEDSDQIRQEIAGRRFSVGIKRLLDLLDVVCQEVPENRPRRLIRILENHGHFLPFLAIEKPRRRASF